MKRSSLLLLPLLTFSSLADTIRMRNGTEYEGVVVSENDTTYSVLIQVTKSIRDSREIPKTEVLEIVGEKKDAKEFEVIEAYVPTPDLMELESYNARIARVEAFLKEHSTSRLARKAKPILKTLKEEQTVVAAGGVKYKGQMIQAEDRASRAYSFDAEIAASKVKTLAEAGDFVGALRAWKELETNFPSSSAYTSTIPYAVKLMKTLQSKINQSLSTFDARMKKREEGLERVPAKDRKRTIEALAEEAAAYDRRISKEKEAKIVWLSVNPNNKEIMSAMKSKLEQNINRLSNLKLDTIPDGDAAWKTAWDVLNGSPTPSEASSAISAARTARISNTYIEILEAKAPGK